MAAQLELYEHSHNSLIPLLRYHLPASILVLGTILAPLSLGPDAPKVRVWSTIPPSTDGSPVPSDTQGTIIVPVPPLYGSQIRVFDTYESVPPAGQTSAALEAAKIRVMGALRSYVTAMDPTVQLLGALHELWVEAAEAEIGDGVHRTGCALWLPPASGTGEERRIELGPDWRRIGDEQEYELDIGRDVDAEHCVRTADIPRDPAYYYSRLPWSTIIRPRSSSTRTSIPSTDPDAGSTNPEIAPLACRVFTHADGTLGLFTAPEHRRKGLAQWAIGEHIRSGRGLMGGGAEGQWACAVVYEENGASQKLFGGMGWTRAWGCSWVAVDRSRDE